MIFYKAKNETVVEIHIDKSGIKHKVGFLVWDLKLEPLSADQIVEAVAEALLIFWINPINLKQDDKPHYDS